MTVVQQKPMALLSTSLWEWYLDSGCTQHMTPEASMFTTLQKYKQPMVVRIADASDLEVEGIGTIEFTGTDGKPYVLSVVLYLPR